MLEVLKGISMDLLTWVPFKQMKHNLTADNKQMQFSKRKKHHIIAVVHHSQNIGKHQMTCSPCSVQRLYQ